MKRTQAVTVILIGLLCRVSAATEPVIGGTCEGCKNVFVGMPDEFDSRSRIAAIDAPGDPLIVQGTVRTDEGDPAAGIIVYAYQTNADGIYPRDATRHGKLRAWARTDKNGDYRFDTVRPGSYPGTTIPQHIHLHIIEPGKATYYIGDLLFDDDPLLTAAGRRQNEDARGGSGVGHPEKDTDGVWQVRRDIVLGKNVPGY